MNISSAGDEENIFLAAASMPRTDRKAFLDASCEDTPLARARVERLLAVHGDEAFMEASFAEALALPVEGAAGEQAGDRIGDYRLVELLGTGGFGTVWRAEQSRPVRREVALKIIKLGMDTREVIARFEVERQALAMMDHPNIAKIFDAGATDKGRPFFVMELVQGVPITRFCDEREMGPRERLALFGDVCLAINHAHQKGVIHRDIKPSNVMVTLYGDQRVVKVIDFGIAKATQGKLTDKTLFTRFEQFIGTPAYMSPEQAAVSGLDVDTRSDIYALGVLLYELLTGKPPFDAHTLACAGYDEMRRIIREHEPPKPSLRLSTMAREECAMKAKPRRAEREKLRHLVASDLDWIVMKAIDKDRTRRYQTVNGLALDIARFLADEAVSARPPTAAYQFQKFARRHKTALRAAAGITAVLLASTIVSSWQAVRATRAEGWATAEAERAAAEAERASAAETLAFDRLTEVAAERDAKELARKDAEDISKFLGEVFQSPDPARDGRTITVAETLDTAARKLDGDLAAQPARRAKLQAALGRTYFALGLARQAVPLEEKVRDYYLATFGLDHADTLSSMSTLAQFYSAADRPDEALKLREQVAALLRKVSGPEHPDTLKAMGGLALSYAEAGRNSEALTLREEVLAFSRKVNGPEHLATIEAMDNLASSYLDADRGAEAFKMQEDALALRRKVSGPEHPDTLRAMGRLALSYAQAGRQDDALRMRDEALALCRKFLGANAPDTLSALSSLAVSYSAVGRRAEALKMKEEVLALCRKVLGPKDPQTAEAAANLGKAYDAVGETEKAITAWSEAVRIVPRNAEIQYYLSRILCFGERYAEALKPLRAACVLYPDGERGREMRERLAKALTALGRTAEALPLQADVSGGKSEDTAKAIGVAALQAWFGKTAEHAATSARMIQWAKDATEVEDFDRVAKLTSLRPVADASQREAALALARKAVKLGQEHQWLSFFKMALGMAEFRCGHYPAADQAMLAAAQLAASEPSNARPRIKGIAGFYRAMGLFQQGRPAEARALFTATTAEMKPLPTDDQNPLADGATHDDLILWLACKEAKALLAEPGAAGK